MSTDQQQQQAAAAQHEHDGQERTPRPPDALKQLGDRQIGARLVRQKIWRPCNVENQHFMAGIVGREGSGKSGTALSICETVDPGFNAERVFFDPADFMEWCDSDERSAGDAAIVDEAGVGLGSRTWHDEDQILLNKALQTARDDNFVVFFTLPRLSELDSQTRGRLHSFMECVELHEGQHVKVKWKNLEPSRAERDDIRTPFPRLKVDNRKQRITGVRISPPSQELWDAYNERKDGFKSELYEETIASLRGEGGEDGDEELSPEEMADEIARGDLSSYIGDNYGQKYIKKDKIKNTFDIGEAKAKQVKTSLQEDWDVDAI